MTYGKDNKEPQLFINMRRALMEEKFPVPGIDEPEETEEQRRELFRTNDLLLAEGYYEEGIEGYYINNLSTAIQLEGIIGKESGGRVFEIIKAELGMEKLSELSEVTGLSAPTIAAIKNGKSIRISQKNSFLWAIVEKGTGSLHLYKKVKPGPFGIITPEMLSESVKMLIGNLEKAVALSKYADSLEGRDFLRVVEKNIKPKSTSELCKITGLTHPTIRKIREGQPPSPSQKTSIYWSIIKHGKVR